MHSAFIRQPQIMISGGLVCSYFTPPKCYAQEQGGIARRRLIPLRQIKGLNLRYQEPKNLTYDIPKRCSSRIYASLVPNLESLEMPNLESIEVPTRDAFVQESDFSWAKKWDAFCRFTRPYTMYGTVVAIMSVSLLPVQTMADLSLTYFTAVLKTIMPMVFVNIYMSGINQIVDIEIDKINKPHFPLASGEFSIGAASAITTLSGILSIITVLMLNSPPLLYAILIMFFLATVYSVDLPFLRWKGNVFLTSLCFMFDIALVHPLCYFAHFQKYILGRPLVYTKPVLFTVVFMTIMSIVIGIFKDLPDVKGDKAFGLRSPSIIYGEEKVFWFCVYIMMATYGGATIFGATLAFLPNKIITVFGHGILAAILWNRTKYVNISEPSSTYSFYLFIWKLIYAEYLIFPFVR